jgi:carboxymethylenebutenolidase
MPAEAYDPNSPDEQPVPLPSAPLQRLADNVVLQLPLSRRGHGPGLIIFLPSNSVLSLRPSSEKKPLDPEPVRKWAEEGFAVIGIHSGGLPVNETFALGLDALASLESCDTKDKIGVIVYDQGVIPTLIPTLSAALGRSKRVDIFFVAYCDTQTLPDVPTAPTSKFTFPTLLHVPTNDFRPLSEAHIDLNLSDFTIHTYSIDTPSSDAPPPLAFVLPQTTTYAPGHASVAHTRTLVFLRKHLGGPYFDLEKIWDEHAKFEFADRSVAKTMGTMVQEPYVNHVPTVCVL